MNTKAVLKEDTNQPKTNKKTKTIVIKDDYA